MFPKKINFVLVIFSVLFERLKQQQSLSCLSVIKKNQRSSHWPKQYDRSIMPYICFCGDQNECKQNLLALFSTFICTAAVCFLQLSVSVTQPSPTFFVPYMRELIILLSIVQRKYNIIANLHFISLYAGVVSWQSMWQ